MTVLGFATVGWVLATPARSVVFRDRLAQLVVAYLGLNLLLALVNLQSLGIEATSAGIAGSLRYMTIAFVAFVLFRFSSVEWSSLARKVAMTIVGIGVALSVLGLLQVTVLPRDILTYVGYDKELTIAPFMVIDENPDAPRAFATLRGPNEFGAFLILPFVLSLLVIKHRGWKIAITSLLAFGILLSVSRSAWIGAILAAVTLLVLTYGTTILRSKRFVYTGLVGFVLAVGLVISAMSVPSLRLAVFRSSPTDPSLTEGSTDQHLLATLGGIERIKDNPFGCGPGCAGPASYYGPDPHISENYYVQVAEEVGVIGLVLWIAIAWQVVIRLYAVRIKDVLARALLASFVGLSAIGLWLHVWADDPLSLVWWGLAGAVIGYYASAKPKKTVR